MEKYAASFEFRNGVIIVQDSPTIHPDFLPLVKKIREILEPIILMEDLTGTIELKAFEEKLKMNYINVEPFECVPQLMEAVEKADTFAGRNLN